MGSRSVRWRSVRCWNSSATRKGCVSGYSRSPRRGICRSTGLSRYYLRNVSGILLIDEPAEVWEQRGFNFKASFRTFREKVDPLGVDDEYDSDVNPIITADTQAVRFMLTDEGKRELADESKKHDTIYGSYRWILEQAD